MDTQEKKQFHHSYTKKILICVIAASCLPVILCSTLILRNTQHMTYESLKQQTFSDLDSIQTDIELHYTNYSSILETLAETPVIMEAVEGTGSVNDAYSMLYLLTSSYSADAQFHILDRKEKVQISTGTISDDYQTPKGEKWGVLRKAMSSQGTVLSTSDKSQPYNKNIAFSMARAIRKNDEIIGYVVADVFRDVLLNTTRAKISNYGYQVIVADRNNYVAFNSANVSREGLSSYPEELVEKREGKSGSYICPADQQNYLVAYSESELTGLQTIIYMPMNQLQKNHDAVRNAIVTISIPIMLLCMILAALITRNFTKPVRELTQTMRKARKSSLSIRTAVDRADEIGELGYTFNLLMEHIEQLIRQIEEKQNTLREAQIQALCAQINPHFIYNTLDMIKWCGKMNDMEGVTKLTVQLGKLLRMTISDQSEYTTVEQDLEMLGYYVDIQSRRFQDRMAVTYHVDQTLLSCRIPRIILQPLVENVIVHGFRNKTRDCKITISIWRDERYLYMSVADNGCGMPPDVVEALLSDKAQDQHIGIANVRMRAELYGDSECGLEIRSEESVGTTVTLKIVLEEGESQDEQIPGSDR